MAAELKGASDERVGLQEIAKDRYEDIIEIGKGGFGCVYKAWDNKRHQHCAIKQLTAKEHLRWGGVRYSSICCCSCYFCCSYFYPCLTNIK